jgi:hypothetical protein
MNINNLIVLAFHNAYVNKIAGNKEPPPKQWWEEAGLPYDPGDSSSTKKKPRVRNIAKSFVPTTAPKVAQAYIPYTTDEAIIDAAVGLGGGLIARGANVAIRNPIDRIVARYQGNVAAKAQTQANAMGLRRDGALAFNARGKFAPASDVARHNTLLQNSQNALRRQQAFTSRANGRRTLGNVARWGGLGALASLGAGLFSSHKQNNDIALGRVKTR